MWKDWLLDTLFHVEMKYVLDIVRRGFPLVTGETIESLCHQLRDELQAYVIGDAKSRESRNEVAYPYNTTMQQYIKSSSQFSYYNQKTRVIESKTKPLT